MTTLAIVHPSNLVAEELIRLLGQRAELAGEVRLLSSDPDEIGALTEVRGAAALVGGIESSSFDDVDVALLFGAAAADRRLRESLPPAVTAVAVLGLETPADEDGGLVGQPLVAGLNLERLDRTELLISPHPAAVGLAHLLAPLLPFSPRWAAGSAVLPASIFGQAALDELLGQARDMLSFQTRTEHDLLPGPLAFNLLDAGPQQIGRQVEKVLGDACPAVSVQAVFGGIFHGVGLALHLGFEDDPGLDALSNALEENPVVDFAADPHLVGPKDVAGRDELLIADLRATGSGTYALWAVLDHLTLGGARNALTILEALTTPVTH